MKTVTFMYSKHNRANNPLHIEVPGAFINVYIGLKDDSGQDVTRINIQADDYSGEEWRIEDGDEMITSLSARVISVPGYRKQQREVAEKMQIEASHMRKVEPNIDYMKEVGAAILDLTKSEADDAPSLEQCVSDLLREIKKFRNNPLNHECDDFVGILGTALLLETSKPYTQYPELIHQLTTYIFEEVSEEKIARWAGLGWVMVAAERVEDAFSYDNPEDK